MSQHMVIFQNPEGDPGYNQFESIDEAVSFVEKIRNEQSIDSIRIFELDEVKFDLKPYYKVELLALKSGAPAQAPAPAPAAPAPSAPAPAAAAPDRARHRARRHRRPLLRRRPPVRSRPVRSRLPRVSPSRRRGSRRRRAAPLRRRRPPTSPTTSRHSPRVGGCSVAERLLRTEYSTVPGPCARARTRAGLR